MSSRNVIKGSKSIIDSLKFGPSASEGYWQARGFLFPDNDTLMEVPYHDFHENGSAPGSKKNLLKVANSCPTSISQMQDAYTGVLLTQTRAIPNGFFMYSAAIMHTYMTLCEMSRMLKCKPEKFAIIEVLESGVLPVELVEQLYTKLYSSFVALEICTRTFYEGAGSLGGYKERVWLLWGRLSATGCPTDQSLLSDQEAIDAYSDYYEAGYEARLLMFSSWFNEAYFDEFKGAQGKDELGLDMVFSSVSVLFECWEWIKTYKSYEAGREDFDFTDPSMDLADATFYVKALAAGNFRRLSKGITENAFTDYTKAQHFGEAMSKPAFEAIFVSLFSSSEGLCSFGDWLLSANDVACQRIDLYFDEEEDKYGEKKVATKFRNVD